MRTANGYALESAEPVRISPALDRLRDRMELLEHDDQILLDLALNTSATQRRIAEMLGVEPGTVSRRLQRIGQRVNDPIVTRLLDPHCPLGPDYRQIGVEHFLAGRSIATIAQRLGRSRDSVRQTLASVRMWHQLARTPATSRNGS